MSGARAMTDAEKIVALTTGIRRKFPLRVYYYKFPLI